MIRVLLTVLLVLAAVLGALLLLLLILLLLPARVRIALKGGGCPLWAGLGPARIQLLPPKPKKKKKRKPAKKQKKAAPAVSPVAPPEQAEQRRAVTVEEDQTPAAGGPPPGRPEKKKLDFNHIKLTVRQLTEYIRLALDSMGRLCRRITVRRFQIHAVIATGDAASTALAFGSAAAALNLLWPELDRRLRVKNPDIAVDCAFDRRESAVEFDIEISAIVIRLLIVSLRAGLRFWKLYQKNEEEKAVLL